MPGVRIVRPDGRLASDYQTMLQLMADGLTAQQIARELGIGVEAARSRAGRLMDAVEALTWAHVVAIGYQRGWLRAGRPLQPCGTPAAYRRHKRRGEPIDDACRDAESERCMDYQRTKGRRPAERTAA